MAHEPIHLPDTTPYYAARAPEYDAIYDLPERQEELAVLRSQVAERLVGRRVLEVACGTGYWTQVIAPAAERVLATDKCPTMLERAAGREVPAGRVSFALADAFALEVVPGAFDSVLAAFFCSHILRAELPRFLAGLRRVLPTGGRIVLLDNIFSAGSSTPVARTDAAGNSYQTRRLRDGSTFEVLKNFLSEAELRIAAGPYAAGWTWLPGRYYWLASFDLPPAA